jgi:AhpD family alkylhydroperoxidase
MKNILTTLALLLFAASLPAQSNNDAYTKAKQEIEATFGSFPSFFKALPQSTVPVMWEYFKVSNNPNNAIPPKYRELINLAVASQIPCVYCIYYHTEAAKGYGATDEEVKEAVFSGATTRNWSMIMQGSQVDFEAFKKEFQQMMAFMAANTKKN